MATMKNKEQKYLENFLISTIMQMPGGAEVVLERTIAQVVFHTSFTEWLNTPVASSLQKEAFAEIDYALDVARFVFKQLVPIMSSVDEFAKRMMAMNFGRYRIYIDVEKGKPPFIYLKDSNYKIALYNGN